MPSPDKNEPSTITGSRFVGGNYTRHEQREFTCSAVQYGRQIYAGVSIKFEVGSWLKKNNRLYEQGAVRPINLGGSGGMVPQKILKSGGSEMLFPTLWAPNYHASTSGNYSLIARPFDVK